MFPLKAFLKSLSFRVIPNPNTPPIGTNLQDWSLYLYSKSKTSDGCFYCEGLLKGNAIRTSTSKFAASNSVKTVMNLTHTATIIVAMF